MGMLDGKVAIVTGAGQGVGRGIALALAAEGCRVAVAGRTLEKVETVAGEIEARGVEALPVLCEVGDPEQIDACVARTAEVFGGIQILVNNAQVVPLGKLLEVEESSFEAGWQTGPLATLRFMRACHPHLCGDGNIVNLGTGAALRSDPIGYGCYTAVKEAIRALTRAAAVEWGSDGIRVNAIIPLAMSPGMEMWVKFRPEEAEAFMSTIPLGRGGDCEQDVGRAVMMLVSANGGYITGSTLMLDGGQAFMR